MMNLFTLLFSFRGRINRAKYWLAVLIYELGCLRGTPGPNRFGPDPLATVTA